MTCTIEQQTELTPSLKEAFQRLLPQLSTRLKDVDNSLAQSMLADEHTHLFVAKCEERIYGMLTLTYYDVPSGRKAWIEDVVVDDAVRGQGVGRQLVERAIEQAKEDAVGQLMLTSSAHRVAARHLYREVGFEESQTTVFVLK